MAVATLGVTTGYTVGTASAAVCATNTQRRGLIVQNSHASAVLFVGIGTGNAVTSANGIGVLATATSTQGGLSAGPFAGSLVFGSVQPNTSGSISIPAGVPNGDVAVIATITNLTAVVLEW